MRTDGHTIRGHEMEVPHLDLQSVKEWVRATLTKERMIDVALCAATLVVIGVVVFSLHRAMENYTIVGTFPL